MEYIEPAEAEAQAATIDAVLAQPWTVRVGEGGAPPRRESYKAVALSLLGKKAVPLMLEHARAIIAQGEIPRKKREPEVRVQYYNVCILASAAFVIEPKSAPDFLPVLAKIPRTNPPKVAGATLSITKQDLKGTLNQSDPFGHRKMREESRKAGKAPRPEKEG